MISEDGLETAHDHPLSVEGHFADRFQALCATAPVLRSGQTTHEKTTRSPGRANAV